jgi:hypothetical protein
MSAEVPQEKADLLQDYRAASSSSATLDLEDKFAQEMTRSSEFDESNILGDVESRSRRLLELHLLTNYIDRTSKTFGACHHEGKDFSYVNLPFLYLFHRS